MPLALIYVMEGRTEEQKRQLVAAVTEAIQASVGAPADAVRVIVQEIPKTQWGIGGKTAQELGR